MYFTGTSTQKIAEKAGFKVVGEIAYDYKNEKDEVIIPVVGTELWLKYFRMSSILWSSRMG